VSPGWVDSHCHLQEQYLPGLGGLGAVEALQRAAAAGVTGVVVIGTDEETSRQAVELVAAAAEGALGTGLPAVRASIGLHPHEATEGLDWLEVLLEERPPGVVGLGECGLDFHYDHSPRQLQRRSFIRQIELAKSQDLSLVIHARDAWEELFAVLDEVGPPDRTVLHCFTGGPAEAAGCVERGLAVSFSGIVTFKSATEIRDAVREVPLDRLLVETDSPWLAPVPHRGAANEPAWVGLVGEAVAAAGGWEADELARVTSANASRLFGLPALPQNRL
jgi:TatD DNase family protein